MPIVLHHRPLPHARRISQSVSKRSPHRAAGLPARRVCQAQLVDHDLSRRFREVLPDPMHDAWHANHDPIVHLGCRTSPKDCFQPLSDACIRGWVPFIFKQRSCTKYDVTRRTHAGTSSSTVGAWPGCTRTPGGWTMVEAPSLRRARWRSGHGPHHHACVSVPTYPAEPWDILAVRKKVSFSGCRGRGPPTSSLHSKQDTLTASCLTCFCTVWGSNGERERALMTARFFVSSSPTQYASTGWRTA